MRLLNLNFADHLIYVKFLLLFEPTTLPVVVRTVSPELPAEYSAAESENFVAVLPVALCLFQIDLSSGSCAVRETKQAVQCLSFDASQHLGRSSSTWLSSYSHNPVLLLL